MDNRARLTPSGASGGFDFEAYFDKRYVGKSWAQVMEENEYFDGEPEITAAAKANWKAANKRARQKTR